MKKSLLIACLSLTGVFAVCASVMVFANNRQGTSDEAVKTAEQSVMKVKMKIRK